MKKLGILGIYALWLVLQIWPAAFVALILEFVISWDLSLKADLWVSVFAFAGFVMWQLIMMMDGDEDGLSILGAWRYNRRNYYS